MPRFTNSDPGDEQPDTLDEIMRRARRAQEQHDTRPGTQLAFDFDEDEEEDA